MSDHTPERARAHLRAFELSQPDNFLDADPDLLRVLRRWAGEAALTQWEPNLKRFGAECAGPVDRAVRTNGLRHNLPRLDRYAANGERIEQVQYHPTYHEAGRYIYGSGVVSVLAEPGNYKHSAGLFFLSAQNGEAGHNCPVAATAGALKALQALGTPELKERFVPRLASPDSSKHLHATQFLTEIQGGSDVGANQIRAEPVEGSPGRWRIHGEKWFCSNANADLIVITARPAGAREGTAGLGLFLVPKHLEDGSHNAYAYRRLKEKVGHQSLPTAEIDFNGASAWNLGALDDGFHHTMTYVINVSRLFNALATAGSARRACHVATGYARHRRAFGHTIIDYPLVQETLADMKSETSAMVSGSFYLCHLMDRIELKQSSEHEEAFLRLALNFNKLRTAKSAHEVILSGIEVLGGNGAIETFSVLPRLMRDNIIYETWEGTHNTLILQVLRDSQRKNVHSGFFEHLRQQVTRHAALLALVESTSRQFEETLAGGELIPLSMRELANTLAWLQWAAAMVQDEAPPDLIEHFIERRLKPGGKRDPRYLQRIQKIAQA